MPSPSIVYDARSYFRVAAAHPLVCDDTRTALIFSAIATCASQSSTRSTREGTAYIPELITMEAVTADPWGS